MIHLRPPLTTRNVLSRVNSLEIFEKYCDNFEQLNKKFKDRPDDKDASAVITFWGGDYLYKDFGKVGSYRAIAYVAYKHSESYIEALRRVNQDFRLGLGTDIDIGGPSEVTPKPVSQSNLNLLTNVTNKERKPSIIKVKRQVVTRRDTEYWGNYGWTPKLLEAGRIFPISHYWITNPRKGTVNSRVKIAEEQLAYTFDYYLHEGVFRRKLYFPGEELRFISNVDYTIVQGYPMLPRTGDILFVTSSLKDCGPFWRLGYSAIAPNSENEFFYETFVNKLKSRFKRIIIWFDNDYSKKENQGIKFAKHFAARYDLEYTYNPDSTAKDPSDFVYHFGIEEFGKLLQHNLSNTLKVLK